MKIYLLFLLQFFVFAMPAAAAGEAAVIEPGAASAAVDAGQAASGVQMPEAEVKGGEEPPPETDAAAPEKPPEASSLDDAIAPEAVRQKTPGKEQPAAAQRNAAAAETPETSRQQPEEAAAARSAVQVPQQEALQKAASVDKKPRKAAAAKPQSKQRPIAWYVEQLNRLNEKMQATEDESQISQVLAEENRLLGDLMRRLRVGGKVQLPFEAKKSAVRLLRSRIAINQERGNQLAVQRDQIKLEYYKTARQLRDFLTYLIKASKNYESLDSIVMTAEKVRKQRMQVAEKVSLPEADLETKVYAELTKNYAEFQLLNGTFLDILNYVINSPRDISSSLWFQQFTLISVISYFNDFDFIAPVNNKLAPFKIDVGGILVSLIIIALIVFCYPLVVRGSSWLIEKYMLQGGKEENSSLIYQEMKRPIQYLLLFFSIDLATYALLYNTEYKASLENLFFVIYTLIYVWLLFKLLDTVVLAQARKISEANKDLRKELLHLGMQFAKGIIVIAALTFMLNHFGISITAIMSTLGIGGLAFALAAKDTLSNLFGGITILFDNVFRMGDWVKINDVEGTVAEIGLRSTTIRTFDNALVTIPNATISVSGVMNWNRRAVGRRIKMHVGVTYESRMEDIRQAVADIREMLRNHPGIADPREKHGRKQKRYRFTSQEDTMGIKSTQLVFLDRYGDFSIDILIYCFSKTVSWAEWLEVKEDVLFQIAEILEKNNLEFAYPTEVNIIRQDKSKPGGDDFISGRLSV